MIGVISNFYSLFIDVQHWSRKLFIVSKSESFFCIGYYFIFLCNVYDTNVFLIKTLNLTFFSKPKSKILRKLSLVNPRISINLWFVNIIVVSIPTQIPFFRFLFPFISYLLSLIYNLRCCSPFETTLRQNFSVRQHNVIQRWNHTLLLYYILSERIANLDHIVFHKKYTLC